MSLKMGDFNTPTVISFSKENGGLKFTISKPPLSHCILFGRIISQPPKQRFFIIPLGDLCSFQIFAQ